MDMKLIPGGKRPRRISGETLDSSDFFQPSSDDKGHNARIQTRVPPHMFQQVEVFRSSDTFPYDTSAQLVRHAISRHLEWLAAWANKLKGKVSTAPLARLKAVRRILYEEKMSLDFLEVVEQLQEVVNRHNRRGDDKQAARVVAEVKKEIQGMEKGHWRKAYLEELEKRFPDLY